MANSKIVHVLGVLITFTLWLVAFTSGHAGTHGTADPGQPPEKLDFNDPKIAQDEAHIKEHLKDQINVNKQMSPQELEFHYFRLHDTNNDTKLDGLEILAALSHMADMFEVKPHEKVGKTEEQIAALQQERSNGAIRYYSEIIDKVLVDDDFNRDGYISYPEYVTARRRDVQQYQAQMAHQQQMAMQQQMSMQQAQQFQQFQQWQQQQQFQQQPPPAQAPGTPPQQQQVQYQPKDEKKQ